MHEIGVAEEIVAVASDASGGARVRRLVIEIGKLSLVLPDALRFCFDLVAEGTPLEGASLDIVETPGAGRCRDCGTTTPLDRPFGRCACGATDLELIAGEELRIASMEVT